MAAILDRDRWGEFVVIECDYRRCDHHESGRPGPGMTTYDLLCAVFDAAQDDGWRLAGRTYCPHHARSDLASRVHDWARVRRGSTGRSSPPQGTLRRDRAGQPPVTIRGRSRTGLTRG
jgi:hypothetical protein